jgi:hypothetical protein
MGGVSNEAKGRPLHPIRKIAGFERNEAAAGLEAGRVIAL